MIGRPSSSEDLEHRQPLSLDKEEFRALRMGGLSLALNLVNYRVL